tara:strand:+ start:186 stop:1535 length:1350 start_codon:yes stop_codon:yes gene_type:complete
MVRKAQDIQAAYELESTYGDAPDTTLYHLGLLDTFDPRAIEMNITPVPSIGQSTDAHHAAGPIDVTLPLKIALQGDGWKEMLGNAIGRTHIDDNAGGVGGVTGIDAAHCLTGDIYSHVILAKDLLSGKYTACNGVVVNEATIEADYTAGGFVTLEAQCTAQFSEDSSNGNFTFNPTGGGAMAYNDLPFPNAPSATPLLPSDLTVSYSTTTVSNALVVTDTAGNYIEVGERYMRFFKENDNPDDGYAVGGGGTPIVAEGVIDLNHGDYDSGNRMTTLKTDINAIATTCTENSATTDPQNLLKGIYKMTAGTVNIPAVASTTQTLTEFPNLRTVSLKITNNNTSIPGKIGGKWLQNKAMARGKADIVLDVTMTGENEDLYDKYVAGATLPLVRLDFGDNGSIALTNGTITSFSRPLTGGGEVVDTLSIKFRGNGDYRNYSAFAISTDLTLQ